MANNWHYAKGGEKHGPISAAQLKEVAQTGQLDPDDLVWREDMKEWRKASSVKGLFPQQPATTKTPPPPPASQATTSSEEASLWDRPAILTLLVICCFPVGLFLLWKSPRVSQGQKTLWTGVFAGLFVLSLIVSIFQSQATEKDLARANALWDEGKQTEAVSLYQTVVKERDMFIPDEQKPVVYGRMIDHLAEQGSEEEARTLLQKLDRSPLKPAPLLESEAARALVAKIKREQEAERQREESEKRERAAQAALARAAKNPISLSKSERIDFLDNTKEYQGKAVKTEARYMGGGIRRSGRLLDIPLLVFHSGGSFEMSIEVPTEVDQPNIQSGDYLLVTFFCEEGDRWNGNRALKIERP